MNSTIIMEKTYKNQIQKEKNYNEIDISKYDEEQYQSLLKTKKILKEFSAIKGNFLTAEQLYAYSLSHNTQDDINQIYGLMANSASAEYIYKFANYFADYLDTNQMRVLYKQLVDMDSEIYIHHFIRDVLPKINKKDSALDERER